MAAGRPGQGAAQPSRWGGSGSMTIRATAAPRRGFSPARGSAAPRGAPDPGPNPHSGLGPEPSRTPGASGGANTKPQVGADNVSCRDAPLRQHRIRPRPAASGAHGKGQGQQRRQQQHGRLSRIKPSVGSREPACFAIASPATKPPSPGSAPRSPSPAPACRPQGDQRDGVGRCGLSSRTT